MLIRILIIFVAIFFVFNAQAQKLVKTIPAKKTTAKIIIDGDISDSAWLTAPIATDFVEQRPSYGKHEDTKVRTEVYMLYSDDAIYIGGFCHELSIDSISKELVGRDQVGVNDFVGVLFDTYNDKINGFGYYVTPLGEQFDAKYSNTGEDGSWNSVYESQAKILSNGWTFEMRIPYSAIRFANKNGQDWGLTMTRRRSKAGKQLFWYPLDPTIGGTLFSQAGLWTGIEKVKLPLRLSLSPYLATYAEHYPYNETGIKNWSSSINGGMDVKYGINQSFTLDMTLVPDFGQVQSDNHVLNLSPFEVKYNENRTFFTEGTELFSKGNYFYSRRIGGDPIHQYDMYNSIGSTEIVTKNPSSTKLINATKISGRTSNGLGIGVLNALSSAQYATIEDTVKHTSRKYETSTLTNYNIIVLDKALKNNSSVSFFNSSVMRSGKDYDANVTAGLWDIYDKKSNYNFFGQIAVSQLYSYLPDNKTKLGYSHNIAFSKTGGRFNFNYWNELSDNKYDQNDLGYATNNNYMTNGIWIGYKWIKPTKYYNNIYFNFNANYTRRYKPSTYQQLNINTNINGQLKNLWNGGIYAAISPTYNDFYEGRLPNTIYKAPTLFTGEVWVNTNSAKKYSAGIDLTYQHRQHFNTNSYYAAIYNQYRFNKKLTVTLNNNFEYYHHARGFATFANNFDSSIFGKRNRTTIDNILNIKYNFTNKRGLTLRVRHYWSKVIYSNYYNLEKDGSLKGLAGNYNANRNVDFFNVDMVYTWQFALGSFLNIGWKNATELDNLETNTAYFKNLSNTINAPQANNFSVKIIYFFDVQKVLKKKVTT